MIQPESIGFVPGRFPEGLELSGNLADSKDRYKMKPSLIELSLRTLLATKQPTIIWGEPGIGKTSIGQSIATSMGMQFCSFRACLLDPVDLRGLPWLDAGQTRWAPPVFLPTGNAPVLLLLDELNRAPTMVQNALLELILERRLGEYVLPEHVALMAACNRESDGGGVQRMNSALSSRFAHLDMEPDLDDFCRWAVQNGIHPMVVAFVRFRPNLLCQFNKAERVSPNPRSWEFVSNLLHAGMDPAVEFEMLCGIHGKGCAIEFHAFCKMFRGLVTPDAILLDPQQAPLPQDPPTMFAVSSALAHRATVTNLGQVLTYLDRMPPEFAVFAVQDAARRDRTLTSTPEFTNWAIGHSELIF